MGKKKKEAHHGGAWKVAYADFVTALMALFMVLWICAQDKKILLATSKYFQSPFRSPLAANSGVMPFDKTKENASDSGKTDDKQGENTPTDKNKQIELSFLNAAAADFYRLLHLDENLDQKPIDVQVTSDGLRVTLFDRARRPLFVDRSAQLTEWGRFVMQDLAWLIDRHHFFVTIDGHTRTGLTMTSDAYGPWELSSDRANTARRSLVKYAVDPSMIERVTGYANTRPLAGIPETSDANERITLSLTLVNREKDHEQVSPVPSLPAAAKATASATPTPISPSAPEAAAPRPSTVPFQPPLSVLP
ncbi:MAG TPA: flagellar motor protein MotB [Opitutaceae bacterium]|jgi:chemotaxis protein MotB